ncbi:MAG TPA: XdhC family protein [Gaiellaceae bacterium]|nr:XdhC family protein [Gaiellaceae bacterium]
MKEIAADLRRWRERGDASAAIATVVATRGSAPRPIGAKLAVSEHGELAGSVSGGCVENEVYEEARGVLGGAPPKLLSYGISDEQAWTVGLPCGGEIDVFLEQASLTDLEELVRRIESGERFSRTTVLDDEGREFVENFGPPPLLLVFGAVDTAEALCKAARELGWRTVVADARGKFATRERIPSADEILVEWPEQVLEHVQPDDETAIVVLTHESRFDIPALKGALETDAFYVGALGARRNQERRRGRLLEEGMTEDDIDRISGPSGLDIGAHTPAETAVSILAEILTVRAGRSGGRLKDSKGRIHAEVAEQRR